MSLEIFKRLALTETEQAGDDVAQRVIRMIFATSNVALDGHRILPGAWEGSGWDGLADYRGNPVYLWAHDARQPPVGKVIGIGERAGLLTGAVQFADYDFADTVYRLYRDGFMRGSSVSWLPVDWTYATGRDREAGAIDFKRVQLLEISAVPLPCDMGALAAARAFDLGKAIAVTTTANRAAPKDPEWKCGASRNLPLDEESDWDGPAAAASIFEACGFDGDKPDTGKAKKGFLAFDSANPSLKGSYKLPIAKVVDGRMTAVASGVRAAASRLPQTDDLPEDVKDKARDILDHYEEQMTDKTDRQLAAPQAGAPAKVSKRGLWELSSLCYILCELGWIKKSVDAEETNENDSDSTSPANLLAAIKIVGQTLTEMAEEEVQELIDSFGSLQIDDDVDLDDDGDEVIVLRSFARRLRGQSERSGRKLSKSDAEALEDVHDHARRSRALVRAAADQCASTDMADPDQRAAAQDAIEAAHDHSEQTRAMVRSYIDNRKTPAAAANDSPGSGANPENPDATGDAAADERSLREQRARDLLRRSLRMPSAA